MIRCDCRELRCLLLDGLDDPRMLVADVHVDELAREVEVAATIDVPDLASATTGKRQRSKGARRGPGVEDARSVALADARVRVVRSESHAP